jgi:hypothetical protein
MKLTPWYRGDQKPVRVGVFKRRYPSGSEAYCWWDEEGFSNGCKTVYEAKESKDLGYSLLQSLPWRGVAK